MQKLSFNRYFSFSNATSYVYSTTEDGVVMKNITNDKACDTILKLLNTNSNTNNSYSSEQNESLNSFVTDITVNFAASFLGLNTISGLRINLDGRSSFASFIGPNMFLLPKIDVSSLKKP